MSKDLYEVYMCKFQYDVLYIGSGKIGRHTHCDSGISNVYGLNRLHFGGVELDVKVLKTFKNQKDSIDEEVRLIKLHNPKFNKVYNLSTNSHKLNNSCYLEDMCNDDLKAEIYHLKSENFDLTDCDDDFDYDIDYFEISQRLYFKGCGNYFLLDTEKTEFDVNNECLLNYKDEKLYSKREVELFCCNILLYGTEELAKDWKSGNPDLDTLLQDTRYVIEYT